MRLSWVLCLVILIGPVCTTARADVESAKLKKYREPVDKAVSAALEWLVKNQAEDGSYPGDRFGKTSAIVGLAGMAFLSKGYTPGKQPYGDEINKCLDYVLARQGPNGSLDAQAKGNDFLTGGGMYTHGIATLFLSECSGMVDPDRQEKIDQVLPKALKLILDAQQVEKGGREKGGWRYTPITRESDISVTGWQVMALRSARLNGAQVPKKAIDDAVAFILRTRHEPSGGFCYFAQNPVGPGVGRTGLALLCLELTGHHNDEITRAAGDFVLNNLKPDAFIADGHPAYATYYAANGMFQLGGDYWEQFAEQMYKYLIRTQHEDGHWDGKYGSAYGTVLKVLALTVSYRQLPIYQR